MTECGWCGRPIQSARVDARFCGKKCRQSSWRFGRGCSSRAAAAEPKRLAYADPPYPGLAGYYEGHPDYAGEVDHADLLSRLQQFDGWALSTNSLSLQIVLALCPPGVRVAAWVRGDRPGRAYNPLQAWEPVIYRPGRVYLSRLEQRRSDALVFHSRPRLSDPRRVVGAKPAEFAWWMFDLIGAFPGDELVDIFPGSGGIGRAWDLYGSCRSSPATTRVA